MNDYIVRAGNVATFALTLVALAEKAAQHSEAVSNFWTDLKGHKAAYDRRVMADAIVLCYGPQMSEDAIERTLADFRRTIPVLSDPPERMEP